MSGRRTRARAMDTRPRDFGAIHAQIAHMAPRRGTTCPAGRPKRPRRRNALGALLAPPQRRTARRRAGEPATHERRQRLEESAALLSGERVQHLVLDSLDDLLALGHLGAPRVG